MVMHP